MKVGVGGRAAVAAQEEDTKVAEIRDYQATHANIVKETNGM